MFEIYTAAQPRLKTPGIVTYQIAYLVGIHSHSSLLWHSLMNEGYEKMPRNVGNTSNVPKTYHGVLLPHDVLNLSLRTPTIGVITPSASWPDNIDPAVAVSPKPTTFLMYHVKYTNHMLAHKSLQK